MQPRPIEEYHEDMGDVLWWTFPINEPPYVGSPLDLGQTIEVEIRDLSHTNVFRRNVGGWPGYHTHFTPIPIPEEPIQKRSDVCDTLQADWKTFHESLRGFAAALRSGAMALPDDAELLAQKFDAARFELARLTEAVAAWPQQQAAAAATAGRGSQP